jgi:transposase
MTTPSASSQNPPCVFIGIDVSKATLDLCLKRESGKPLFQQFANDAAGHAKLLAWSRNQSTHASRRFCLEATGAYGEAIAIHLHEAGEYVSVINPTKIKYSGPDGAANKTDKAAALKIAQFARLHEPDAWQPPAPEIRELVALVRHLDDLIAEQAKIKVRLTNPGLVAPVKQSLKALLSTLAEQIKSIEAQIDRHIDNHPDLKQGRDLLDSIPGIAKTTAQRLLAEMPPADEQHSAQSAAAYAGLSPREHRSGTSVHRPTCISKAGNKHLRRALYMPALCAIIHNPRVRALAERMKAAGKPRMAIVAAAMRKLLMIAYGVLKSGQTFTAEIAKPQTRSLPQGLTT